MKNAENMKLVNYSIEGLKRKLKPYTNNMKQQIETADTIALNAILGKAMTDLDPIFERIMDDIGDMYNISDRDQGKNDMLLIIYNMIVSKEEITYPLLKKRYKRQLREEKKESESISDYELSGKDLSLLTAIYHKEAKTMNEFRETVQKLLTESSNTSKLTEERFGIGDENEGWKSLKSMAIKYGVSIERMRFMEKKARKKAEKNFIKNREIINAFIDELNDIKNQKRRCQDELFSSSSETEEMYSN